MPSAGALACGIDIGRAECAPVAAVCVCTCVCARSRANREGGKKRRKGLQHPDPSHWSQQPDWHNNDGNYELTNATWAVS
jgi:hypothetical protein